MTTKPKIAVCVVAALIAIVLAVILVDRLNQGTTYPAAMSCETDLVDLRLQINLYKKEQGHYPTTEEGLSALVKLPSDPDAAAHWNQRFYSVPLDPWKRPYRYRCPGYRNPGSFEVYSVGPDGVESSDDIYPPPGSDTAGK
jgi:general secretion pathway protein G